jgi:hypothetical protein
MLAYFRGKERRQCNAHDRWTRNSCEQSRQTVFFETGQTVKTRSGPLLHVDCTGRDRRCSRSSVGAKAIRQWC